MAKLVGKRSPEHKPNEPRFTVYHLEDVIREHCEKHNFTFEIHKMGELFTVVLFHKCGKGGATFELLELGENRHWIKYVRIRLNHSFKLIEKQRT